MAALDKNVMLINTKKGEIVANWYLKYRDPESNGVLGYANDICMKYCGLSDGEFENIINGNFSKYSLAELVTIGKTIYAKEREYKKNSKKNKAKNN